MIFDGLSDAFDLLLVALFLYEEFVYFMGEIIRGHRWAPSWLGC